MTPPKGAAVAPSDPTRRALVQALARALAARWRTEHADDDVQVDTLRLSQPTDAANA
jgi:hypothetical protein